MSEHSAERIAARLEEAANAIERSLHRTRRSIGSAASDMGEQSRTAVEKEWAALKKDLGDLMSHADLPDSPEVRALVDRIRSAMNQATESVADAAGEAQRRARDSALRVNDYAHASPWQAAGIAAAAGFVIGVLLSRK